MVSITDGPNAYNVYSLTASSVSELPTVFPFECANGTLNTLGDGSSATIKGANGFSVVLYSDENNSWA